MRHFHLPASNRVRRCGFGRSAHPSGTRESVTTNLRRAALALILSSILVLAGCAAISLPGATPTATISDTLDAAAAFAAKGQYTAAEIRYRQALDAAPDDPAPALALADLYLAWGRPTDGLAALDTATARGATAGQADARRLALLSAAGEWRQVADRARRVLEATPTDRDALDALTRATLHLGACDEARDAARRAAAGHPTDTQAVEATALLDGDYVRLADVAPGLVAGLGTCSEGCDRAVGMRLVREGRWGYAACLLARASAADPQDAEIQAWLGESYARLDLQDDAYVHLRTAVELAPDLPQAWLLLGKLALVTGNLDDARVALLNAQKLDPANPAACLAVAELQARAGKYGEVDRWTQAALDRAPEDAEIWKAVARFYLSRDLAGNAVARTATSMAVDLAPDDAEAYLLSGWIQLLQGRPAEALEALDRAVALDPTLAEAYYRQAQALSATGDRARAEQALTRAADLGYR